jgi:hypothetical protein
LDRRLNRLHAGFLASALAGLAFFSGHALAQGIIDIPQAVVSKATPLSSDEESIIRQYVEENSKNLLSTDPVLLRRDRNAILAKLDAAQVGVPFRLAYDSVLQPHLQAMLNSPEQKTVINGLVIAGSLATDRSLNLVTSKLQQGPVAVRYEAASSLGRVFKAAANHPLSTNQLPQTVRNLERYIADEKDPHVRDALVRAALAAAEMDDHRAAALSSLSRGLTAAFRSADVKNPSEADLNTFLRGCVGVRDIAARAHQQQMRLPAQPAKDAAEMAGAALIFVNKVLVNAPQPNAVPDRQRLADITASAQRAIELAGPLLDNNSVNLGVRLAEAVRLGSRNGDAQFGVDVNQKIVPTLAKPPFELSPDRFR